jgi:hypothetical protein
MDDGEEEEEEEKEEEEEMLYINRRVKGLRQEENDLRW